MSASQEYIDLLHNHSMLLVQSLCSPINLHPFHLHPFPLFSLRAYNWHLNCNALELHISSYLYCSISPRERRKETGGKKLAKPYFEPQKCLRSPQFLGPRPMKSPTHFHTTLLSMERRFFWTSCHPQILTATSSMHTFVIKGVAWSKTGLKINPQKFQ